MDQTTAPILLFVSLCQWLITDLVHGLFARMTWGTGFHLVLCPTILSGSAALLVKYLAATRILPVCKIVSGSLMLLLVSWYIDRICRNNAYLMVRAVGVALLFCAALGVVIVSEDSYRQPRLEAETVATVEYVAARD